MARAAPKKTALALLHPKKVVAKKAGKKACKKIGAKKAIKKVSKKGHEKSI